MSTGLIILPPFCGKYHFFFSLKKKKGECVCHTQAHIATELCKVTANTLNLGHVRWTLAWVLECLQNRIVPLSWSGAWEQDKATTHPLVSCPHNCIWSGCFLRSSPPPLLSFLFASFDQCASGQFHKDKGGSGKNTIYPHMGGNEGTRHLAKARYQKFA